MLCIELHGHGLFTGTGCNVYEETQASGVSKVGRMGMVL